MSDIVTPTQLRADLEALHDSVHQGWTCLGNKRRQIPSRHFGAAQDQALTFGCIFHQMYKLTEPPDIAKTAAMTKQGQDRREAMMHALDFPNLGAMYAWNDNPRRTWEQVKERVKDAIGKL